MAHGLRISKPGDDVKTATSKNLAFDSSKGALKIFTTGTLSLTTNSSGNATASAAHNLNYAPGFFMFRKATAKWSLIAATEYTNSFFPVGAPNFYVKDDPYHHAIHAYADGTNIYVQVDDGNPSTTMDFMYLLLVDQSEEFSSADGITNASYGLKIAKSDFDVKTAKEYQLGFSSQYKILQHYAESYKTSSLTFPGIFASYYNTSVSQVSYVDFEHGLGYPPLFMAYVTGANATGNKLVKAPFVDTNGIDIFNTSVSGFADATRIRIYWWRSSTFFISLLDNRPTDTLSLKMCIFTENLNVF